MQRLGTGGLTFLGHYDIRFYCTPGAYVDIGAGSLPCVNNLMLVPAGEAGKVGEIGRFCEMHPSARILVRGEHANDQPVNICFSGLPLVNGGFDQQGVEPVRPFATMSLKLLAPGRATGSPIAGHSVAGSFSAS